jgi:hypothetical protein
MKETMLTAVTEARIRDTSAIQIHQSKSKVIKSAIMTNGDKPMHISDK